MHKGDAGHDRAAAGACLAEVEQQCAADEKALADCIGEAACARKSRWITFEKDFDRILGSLREVHAR